MSNQLIKTFFLHGVHMQHSNGFLNLAEDARKQIKETDVPTIKKRMDNKEIFALIDVREDNEWANGHIPTAIHMGRGIIERDIEKVIPNKNQELVLYCGGGYRSALATVNLQKMGYTNVLSMNGGITAWKDSGYNLDS